MIDVDQPWSTPGVSKEDECLQLRVKYINACVHNKIPHSHKNELDIYGMI